MIKESNFQIFYFIYKKISLLIYKFKFCLKNKKKLQIFPI